MKVVPDLELTKERCLKQSSWASGWADITFFVGTGMIPLSLLTRSFGVGLVGFFLHAFSLHLRMQSYYWATIMRMKFK